MTGISRAYHVLPTRLLERLDNRVLDRGGEREVQFLWSHVPRWLPMWTDHGVDLVRWGCQRNENRQLPCVGWTMLATVAAGKWAKHRPERVEVPASLILHNGRWIAVRQGVQALLVRDEEGNAHGVRAVRAGEPLLLSDDAVEVGAGSDRGANLSVQRSQRLEAVGSYEEVVKKPFIPLELCGHNVLSKVCHFRVMIPRQCCRGRRRSGFAPPDRRHFS
jgi:hypothetical protein